MGKMRDEAAAAQAEHTQMKTPAERADLLRRMKTFTDTVDAVPTKPAMSPGPVTNTKQATQVLREDGSGGSRITRTATVAKMAPFTPRKGRFVTRVNGSWNNRYYTITGDGMLTYKKKNDPVDREPRGRLNFKNNPTIKEMERYGMASRKSCLEITTGNASEYEYIRTDKDTGFFQHLKDIYTHLDRQHVLKAQMPNFYPEDKVVVVRRRMAQREFSSRRDSPTMTRLLQEIVRANQKHSELN